MKFSIIVVCLNAGEKLKQTVDSVLSQTWKDYEILVKDGNSTDGSLDLLERDERIRIVIKKDASIYDAMNQAVKEARGEYFLFLNCGDFLYDEKALDGVAKEIDRSGASLVYGDYERADVPGRIRTASEITDFVCYRNVPNHQVCYYHRSLFEERGYDLSYPIRADYEHFLYCKYEAGASFSHVDQVLTIYEGGGFSESKERQKAALLEHKKITTKYLGKKCVKYKLIMILTLQPLRKKLAESKTFSATYQKLKGKVQK